MSNSIINQAVVAVAGSGTRFLPITKIVPKELLPVLNLPVIHWLLEELIQSGIKDIIIVTKNEDSLIKQYFNKPNNSLKRQLRDKNKLKQLTSPDRISKSAKLTFIKQGERLPYGNGSPILAAKKLLKEIFVYCFGDDLVLASPPATQQLSQAFQKEYNLSAAVAVQRVAKTEIDRYGIVKLQYQTNYLSEIIEKPTLKEAPSNLAVFGRFILTKKIIPILENLPLGKDKELWLVDALHQLTKQGKVLAQPIKGEWLTTGDPLNFLKANIKYALANPLLKYKAKKIIRNGLNL